MEDSQIKKIVETFENNLKKNYIKALIQGRELFAQIILDYIKDGKTIEDIKKFCETTLKSGETTEKVAMGIKEKENDNGISKS